MTKSNRWFLYGPLAIGALILFAWFLLWREGAKAMRTEIESFAELQRAGGVEVAFDDLKTKGFPFFLRGAVDNVAFDTGDARFETARLNIDALPYALDRLIFSLSGDQKITLEGNTYSLRMGDARASVEQDKERGWFLKSQASDAKLQAESRNAHASLSQLLMNAGPATDDDNTLELSLVIDDIGVGSVDIGNTGAIEINRLEAFAALHSFNDASDMIKWRQQGGMIDLRGLAVSVGKSRLSLTGEITIDADGYPAGTFDTEIVQGSDLVSMLRDARLLTPEDAAALEAGLAMAALAGGGKANAQIVLANGHAQILGQRIADLPRLSF